jgi:dTDP-4-amino-4,6-dideoxygalactose transaminase
MHAAVLRVKLGKLAEWNSRREALAARYQEAFSGSALTLPVVRPNAKHAWHLYTIRHPARDAIRSHLEKNGIGTLIHYPIPPHQQKAYAQHKVAVLSFPIAERIHRETLSLPLGPHLSMDQQDRVIASVLEAMEFYSLN